MNGRIRPRGSIFGSLGNQGNIHGHMTPGGGGPPVEQADIIITRDGREITATATQDAGTVSSGVKTATTLIPDEYIIPSGVYTATTNGDYTVTTLTGFSVNVVPPLDDLSITPTESAQSFVAASYSLYGFDEVNVSAIPSTYVGSAITTRTSLIGADNTITALSGYYAEDTTFTMPLAYITPATFSRTKGTTYRVTYTKNVDSAGYVAPRSLGSYMDLTLQTVTATPTTGTQTVTPSGLGYYLDKVVIDPIPSEYIVPSGVYTATSNTTSADITSYKYLNVSVPATTLTGLTVTPTETTTTYTHSGYGGYDNVTVNGIPSDYIGSAVPRKEAQDAVVDSDGNEIWLPAGYYDHLFAVSLNEVYGLSATASVTTSGANAGHLTVTGMVVTGGWMPSGTFPLVTQNTVAIKSGQTYTPSATTQTAVSADTWVYGDIKIAPIPSQYLIPSGTYTATTNTSSVDIGSYKYLNVNVPSGSPSLTNLTVTATTTTATYTHSGYDGYDSVTVNAIPMATITTGTFSKTKGTTYRITYSKSVNSAGYVEAGELGAYTDLMLETPSVTPSTTAQTVTPSGTNFYLNSVTVNPIPSQYVVPTGTYTASANTSSQDITNYKYLDVNVSGGGGKNAQIAYGFNRVAGTAYTAVTGQSITVSKTGTYHVYWSGWRSSTSGTNGTQLYIGNTAYGTANTSFDSTYTNIQDIHLTNVSLTQNQTITVRARSRGNSYYMYVFNLTIVEA